jgi:crossover junction endodeoxyribonuclease RuvC
MIGEFEQVVIGIDPGTNILGYGVIGIRSKHISLLDMGVLRLGKLDDHALKLREIFKFTECLISKWKPDSLSVEAPFFGKNVQSMLKLGRAQGVALAAALSKDIPVSEYAPRTIKQSITGKGAASKEQVAAMLQHILGIKDEDMPRFFDATDGLAAAVCHYLQSGKTIKTMAVSKGAKKGGWSNFVEANPERIQKK